MFASATIKLGIIIALIVWVVEKIWRDDAHCVLSTEPADSIVQ